MGQTYLTTEQLSERIHYDVRTIRDRLKDSVLLEGVVAPSGAPFPLRRMVALLEQHVKTHQQERFLERAWNT